MKWGEEVSLVVDMIRNADIVEGAGEDYDKETKLGVKTTISWLN